MITQAFLAGGATLVAAFVLHRLWLGALPRTVCPDCGEATVGVTHPLSMRTDRWIRRRWCAACGWAGWGRSGPVLWRKKGPVSHTSGFRWGPDRLRQDFGFRWAGEPVADASRRPRTPPAPYAPAAHPSGFRWGDASEAAITTCAQVGADPSGFRFQDRPEPTAGTPSAHPSGFRWGEALESETPMDAEARAFRWADSEPTSRVPRGAAVFRWKS